MRLPAKNATAPAVALMFAIAGALEAAAQTVKEDDLTAPRPLSAPDSGSSGVKTVPLTLDAERSAARTREPRASDAGVRGDYWRGTPFSLLAETLPRIPVRLTSPVARALTYEVLTIPAEPLGGPAIAARLAALRAERLYAMGQLEAAEAAFRVAAIPK